MSRSAYEEGLANLQLGEEGTKGNVPSYLQGADTLNIGNQNKTFLESATDVVESIPKFIGTSIISGVNQLYNVPADVGNLFGGDYDRSDTYEVISEIDSDLGKFYTEHKEGVDLVGFMMSSAVPGLGGIKVLNAGQAALKAAHVGKYGNNMGRAMGLLTNNIKKPALDKALLEATTNSSAASLFTKDAMTAVAGGFGQNALEALAFETAVAATMFNSPILENQDLGDFAVNVAFGAGVFGIVGGAIDSAKISFSLKNVADKAAIEARPWTFIDETADISSPYERLAINYEHLDSIPPLPENINDARRVFLQQSAETKVNKLQNIIRKDIGVIANGDEEVATALYQGLKAQGKNNQQEAMVGLQEISKLSTKSPKHAEYLKLEKKVASGKATPDEMTAYLNSPIQLGYGKMWGEGAGTITHGEKPVITSLVDTLEKGQKITVKTDKHGGTVTAGNFKKRFSLKPNQAGHTTKGPLGPVKAKGGTHWNIFTADPLEADARYIWAQSLDKLAPTAEKPFTVHVNDLPLMEKVFTDLVDDAAMQHVRFTGLKPGEALGSNMQDFLAKRKVQVANKLLHTKGTKGAGPKGAYTQDEIAGITNMRSSALGGELLKDATSEMHIDDLLAMQGHAKAYRQQLINQGSLKETAPAPNIWDVPQNVKMVYDSSPFDTLDNNVIKNMDIIKENQKLYKEGTDRAAAVALEKKYFSQLEEITSGSKGKVATAVPSGAGASAIAAASQNYGTLAASVSQIGKVTANATKAFKERTREALEPLLYKVGNKQEAYLEWQALNQKLRSIEGQYALNESGTAFEPLAIVRWKKAMKVAEESGGPRPARPVVGIAQEGDNLRIDIKDPDVAALAKAHIELNGARTNKLAGIRSAQGAEYNRAPEAFYPIPVNPKDYPFFAMVTDDSITSGNQSKTLFATTDKELQSQIAALKEGNPHLTIRTKREAEEFFDSTGQWSYEKTISANYLDTAAHRKGVSAPFIVSTDPTKITNDMLNWHMQRETGLVREAVSAKYEVPFKELKRLGDEFTNVSSSKFGAGSALKQASKVADKSDRNPFEDYVNTALAIKKTDRYPIWTSVNTMADEAFSTMFKAVDTAFVAAKTPDELGTINAILDKAGYKGAAYTPDMEIFSNLGPARGALTNTIQKANSIMATIVLRWDPLNAVNNAVSANVLLGAETKAVMRAISRGDEAAVGALAKVTNIAVPGTPETIMSPSKMIARAVKKFSTKSDDMQFFRDNGFVTSITDQYTSTLDDLAFRGNEALGSWDTRVNETFKKLKAAGDKGEQLTGNRLAEEFNRFVAADVMKQMTDVAVSRNLMTAKEQLAYINTFVNRTQGNYMAAQRPMMFQGPIGQAIGLFQTYQFNLMQQLLRHVGEGHAKDAMTLLALQGSIHGMNGLPAFNALNTHLVGNASGNTEHKDAYTATYGIAGKNGGDWLMYGAASNALGLIHPDLKMNLYTRGDINPRHVTIVPTDPASVPIVQASAKVLGNLWNTAKKLEAGGDVATTLLQGLEHNSISRPMAGLAQTLQGFANPLESSYSTSKRGNVIAANDLFSIANLSRMAGAKPLDEAIALDSTYRFKAYALRDAKKRRVLGQAIKTTMIAGQDPTAEQIEEFAFEYAKGGGRINEFSQWMGQLYKTANLSQANKLQQNLNSPFSQSMQTIMGGEELEDFTP